MLVHMAIVFLLFYEPCRIDCVIIGASSNHHINNIISHAEKAEQTTPTKIQTGDHAKTVLIQPGHGRSTKNSTIEQNQSLEIKTPLRAAKKKVSPIAQPQPWSTQHTISRKYPIILTHKKAPEDLLKQQVPKIKKKAFHHLTVEDLINRRKELKAKWQSRHSMLQMTPHGLHRKDEAHSKVTTYPEKPHIVEKATKRTPMVKKEKMVKPHTENPKKNLADLYDQVTPRTRRILEHKEEGIRPLNYNTKLLEPLKMQNRFSARYHAPSTVPLPTGNTETTQSQMEAGHYEISGADTSTLEMHPQSEVKNAKHTTQSYLNPMIHEIHRPIGATTELTITTSSKARDISTTSSILTSPTERLEKPLNNDHTTESGNSNIATTEKESTPSKTTLKYHSPDLEAEINGIAKLNCDSKIYHDDTRLEFTHKRISTVTPTPSMDDVASVRIDSSKDIKEISTASIDTPPFHINFSDREKLLHQKPSFKYGKSVEHEDHTLGEVLQKSESTGEGFTNEIEENSTKTTLASKKAMKNATSPPESRAMKIAGKHEVNQDWRENLRRAVKERLRKLRRDSLIR